MFAVNSNVVIYSKQSYVLLFILILVFLPLISIQLSFIKVWQLRVSFNLGFVMHYWARDRRYTECLLSVDTTRLLKIERRDHPVRNYRASKEIE